MGHFLGLKPRGRRAPEEHFSLQKRSIRAVGEGKRASVSHITNTRLLHFIPHSFVPLMEANRGAISI